MIQKMANFRLNAKSLNHFIMYLQVGILEGGFCPIKYTHMELNLSKNHVSLRFIF